MNCPACQSKAYVIDSRDALENTRRRYQCSKCGVRFTTKEIADVTYKRLMKLEAIFQKIKELN